MNKLDPIGQTNYQVVLALTYMLSLIGKSTDIKSTLVSSLNQLTHKDWSNCLDRRQVWNQKRPPWFEALHHLIYPVLTPVINILVSSMQTGATIYQVRAKSSLFTLIHLQRSKLHNSNSCENFFFIAFL